MKKTLFVIGVALCGMHALPGFAERHAGITACDMGKDGQTARQEAEQAATDLSRAIALADSAFAHHFADPTMKMLRYYNPVTRTAETEVGSVWMYTSAIEAVNSILQSLKDMRKQAPELYAQHYKRYLGVLAQLYDGLQYYAGTYTLTSYTQTRQWTVYGVNRGRAKGAANVTGVLNVYDDQQWLIRELLRSYKITGRAEYLDKAEYLTDYVLDGWDCTLNADNEENGGITWGPGYITKHSCSNGPMVSPLVWLYEIYRGKADKVTYRKVGADGRRYETTEKKADYYLGFAKKVYAWQKRYLKNADGVYYDLIGAKAHDVQYETVDGTRYRKGLVLTSPSGISHSYNSGTMLSGTADLYRVTRMPQYLADTRQLATATFGFFAHRDADRDGYYSYSVNGFAPWFNDVLMTGYADAWQLAPDAVSGLKSFQDNLDYAWDNYLTMGHLPSNLLTGWNPTAADNNTEGMFAFAYASEYAMLANCLRQKAHQRGRKSHDMPRR